MIDSTHNNFYLKNKSDQIVYPNFIQVNKPHYRKLLRQGYKDYTDNLAIPRLLNSIKNKTYLFFDNNIHLLYDDKDKTIIKLYANSIKELIKIIAINFFDKKTYVLIFDETGLISNHVSYSSQQSWSSDPKKIGIIKEIIKQDPELFISSNCELTVMEYNQWGQFALANNLGVISHNDIIDNLPEHESYDYQKHTIICSLVNTASFNIFNIISSANFLKDQKIEFAITPDSQCFALTPLEFKRAQSILQKNFSKLIQQEKLGKILDEQITCNKTISQLVDTGKYND